MKKYRSLIKNNLLEGDCGLWFSVLIWNGRYYTECVCPYDKCKSFTDALVYYFKHFHKSFYLVSKISHHKISKSQLDNLAMAC